ncbi:MAG: hypothetical protein ACJAXK_001664 [Yoonia sp.]|jgi:hypothetical protein
MQFAIIQNGTPSGISQGDGQNGFSRASHSARTLKSLAQNAPLLQKGK